MADVDPGVELTRITDELVAIQTRINELRESLGSAADASPEMASLQERLAANDTEYKEFAARVRRDLRDRQIRYR